MSVDIMVSKIGSINWWRIIFFKNCKAMKLLLKGSINGRHTNEKNGTVLRFLF